MKWRYNGIDYDTKHDDSLYGFVYVVYYEDESGNVYKYYGKKSMVSQRKKHFGKKKLAEVTDKRLKTYEIVTTESNWRSYVGSCKDTKDYIPIYKEIIQFARTKRELGYLETKILFSRSALEDPLCLNANVMGRYFRDNLV